MPYFLTFQVVGWADVFSRKLYRDFILENLTYCRNEKGLYLYGFVIMNNHINLVVQQNDGDFKNTLFHSIFHKYFGSLHPFFQLNESLFSFRDLLILFLLRPPHHHKSRNDELLLHRRKRIQI